MWTAFTDRRVRPQAVMGVKTEARVWVWSLGLLMLGSCAGWRDGYLGNAVDRAGQQDVIARLGPPDSTEHLTDGGTAWIYVVGPPEECAKIILLFDQSHLLRNWRREGSCWDTSLQGTPQGGG